MQALNPRSQALPSPTTNALTPLKTARCSKSKHPPVPWKKGENASIEPKIEVLKEASTQPGDDFDVEW